MVQDALMYVENYKRMEEDALGSLCSCGAVLPSDAVADALEALAVRRSWAVAVLMSEYKEANEEERRKIRAALVVLG